MLLTKEQFDGAVKKTRLHETAVAAAERVLVLGETQAEAARKAGVSSRQHVHRAIQAVRREIVKGDSCIACGQLIASNTKK